MTRRAVTILVAVSLLRCASADTDLRKAPLPDADLMADSGGADTSSWDATVDAGDASEASTNGCSWSGAPGQCMTVTACTAIPDHSSFPKTCPGPTTIGCCIDTPDVGDNPPIPVGYKLMQQSQVTSAMTTWAVTILHDPATYPMFSTTTKMFGTLNVLARVEWHPPDFQNNVVHRGVTLYVPG